MIARILLVGALGGMIAGCSLPGLGGTEPPSSLVTLATSAPPPPADITRREAVTFAVPLVPQSLATNRVAAVQGGTAIAYIQDLFLVDTPDRLFQQLVSETVYRSSALLVVDPRQAGAVPALVVTGTLRRFEFDADTQEVVVTYEALWERDGVVGSRRFEAREAATGFAADITPALNRAANRVAADVADWIQS